MADVPLRIISPDGIVARRVPSPDGGEYIEVYDPATGTWVKSTGSVDFRDFFVGTRVEAFSLAKIGLTMEDIA